MLQLLIGVFSTLLLHSDLTAAVCGQPPIVWRSNNITCPRRAVCADVFTTVRDWYNGTTCNEKRVLSNCLCPGSHVCPTNNDDHKLYSSSSHSIYTCEPKCNFAWCAGVSASLAASRLPQANPRTNRQRRPQTDPNAPTSVTTIQNAEEFGDGNYNRIECRCPRHHFPIRGVRRAVKASRYEYDFRRRRYSTLYVCASRENEEEREDPCGE